MNSQEMLRDMCHHVLADIDIRSIYKNRGIVSRGAPSRNHLETVFLSEIGMNSVYATLTPDEITFLHLLKFKNKAVAIAFFWDLYGTGGEKGRHYGTITMVYRDVFNKVKASFIRKGILLMAETSRSSQAPKMEKWRFLFPETLASLLPSPIASAKVLPGSGVIDDRGLRQRIMKIRDIDRRPTTFKSEYSMNISNGLLYLGDRQFTTKYLLQRLHAGWTAALKVKAGKDDVPLVTTTLYGFEQLQANEWIQPNALRNLFKIFCPSVNQPDLESICHIGWEWGCLAKQSVDNQTWYQSVKNPQERGEIAEANYLTDQGNGWLLIDVEKIPFGSLELLANISTMSVDGTLLLAKPHFIRLGNAMPTLRTQPLFTWLKNHAPAFSKDIESVAKRYGKRIIHENLLIAKIQNLSLKVKIERQFLNSGKIISISKEFIAFPKELLLDIEQIVKKSGHVIKKAS